MKSILPIIFIVLVLTGAITYSLAKRAVPVKITDNKGTPANELEGNSTLTPTPTNTNKVTFGNLTVSPTPTVIAKVTPTVVVPVVTENTTKGGQVSTAKTAVKTTTTKTTVCTPVYGAAETCTEHIVVNTGAESAMFFNFAGLAYLGGLASFVKAKSLKR
jgi:hypothetical protein